MNIYVGQIYIDVGVDFPFSYLFQRKISEEFSDLLNESEYFNGLYGSEYELMFNMSAKRDLVEPEIFGPAVFRKTKDVEYTIFLPFEEHLRNTSAGQKLTLVRLTNEIVAILKTLKFDTALIEKNCLKIVTDIIYEPTMYDKNETIVPED